MEKDNTLAFASSYANALTATKLVISGANSAVIMQYIDPDTSSRTAITVGGNTGSAVGSVQTHQLLSHTHTMNTFNAPESTNVPPVHPRAADNVTTASNAPTNATGGNETRPINAFVNYIVKY